MPFIQSFKRLTQAIALGLALNLAWPVPQANAIVGILASWGAGGPLVGYYVLAGIGGAGGVALTASGIASFFKHRPGAGVLKVLGGLAILFVGYVILDEPTASLEISSMTWEQAEKLGLTRAEWEAFQSESPELSAAMETVGAELARSNLTDPQSRLRLVHEQWELCTQSISPEARSAMQKVSRAAASDIERAISAN